VKNVERMWLKIGPVARRSECGNETSASIKDEEFIAHLRDWHLVEKDYSMKLVKQIYHAQVTIVF